MSYAVIRSLLQTQLNSVSSGFDQALENMAYKPVIGRAFQIVHLIPAKTGNPTQGDGFKREAGILQVTMKFPTNAGPYEIQSRIDQVIEGFKRGLALTQGTLRVLIDEAPFIGPSSNDGVWFTIVLSIPYVADVFG